MSMFSKIAKFFGFGPEPKNYQPRFDLPAEEAPKAAPKPLKAKGSTIVKPETEAPEKAPVVETAAPVKRVRKTASPRASKSSASTRVQSHKAPPSE